MSHSLYLTRAFDADYLEREFKRLVLDDPAVALDINNDILVGTGLSGALSLSALRARLGVEIAIVRKHGDSDHAHYSIESTLELFDRRWLFVDDLISSGSTQVRVQKAMKPYGGQYLGEFLYNPPDGYVATSAKLSLVKHYVKPEFKNPLALLDI